VKAVIGLGNPGKKYARTPHNAGFAVIDELARQRSCRLRRSFRFRAHTAKGEIGGERVILVKPVTYMNRSGHAVAAVLRYWKLLPADMIVVSDDADLDLGRMRIRKKGSSGGHRGLASIIESLGSEDFTRVRLGIGRGDDKKALIDHVLDPLSAAEQKTMQKVVERAGDAVTCLLTSGIEEAMNIYNGVTVT
jgi:PTH1 family peptidyl-tRNA hydrolase